MYYTISIGGLMQLRLIDRYHSAGSTMANGVWKIREIVLTNDALLLQVAGQENVQPQPGQYFQVWSPADSAPLAESLFFAGQQQGNWSLAGQIPTAWQPGTRLHWHGPLGHGFNLPSAARRVALVPRGMQIKILPALVAQALAQEASVVWYGDHLPAWLPATVEVLPAETLPDVWSWADYLAMEGDYRELSELAESLGLSAGGKPACVSEILLHAPLVCGGLAECGVCSVRTKSGWKLVCKDGPVFDLLKLELT